MPSGIFANFAGFIWNRRNAALNDTVFDLLALCPTDRVLDIGFGGGYLLNRIMPVVTDGLAAGVDVSAAMVGHAEKRFQKAINAGKLELKCATAEHLPYPDKYFNKVCSTNSIFYWQNAELGFREIKRVLKPGGKIMLCFTNKTSLEAKSFAKHIRLFEAEAVEQILGKFGFQDIKTSSFSDNHRQYCCITARA